MFLNLNRYGARRAGMQWAMGLSLLLLVALFARPVAAQTAAATPAKGARTVLVMGDSLSAGYGMAASEGWVSLLGERLAREHQAVNLGQGFPDDPGAEDIRAKAAEAVISGWNQYPPMMGLPELRAAVATHYAAHQGLGFDPESEVMITSGATEAIAGARSPDQPGPATTSTSRSRSAYCTSLNSATPSVARST